MPGADNLIVEARAALLDAVAALEAHKDSVILIGAQAIYLHTGHATFALAEATKDSDLAIDARALGEDPLLEEAMTRAGFILNPVSKSPAPGCRPTGSPSTSWFPRTLPAQGVAVAFGSRHMTSTQLGEPPDSKRQSSTSPP